MAPSRYQGAEAAGDMPEGTLLKHVFTTKAGLGSGGERRWLLFESLHNVWRRRHGCGACYPRGEKWDGATCLFLNPRTLMLEWALFIVLFYIGNIQTFVAIH